MRPPLKSLRRFLRDRTGATAVEFALILPIFLLTIFGIIEFGRILWIRNTMEYVAETAARYGGINTSADAATIEAYALTQVIAVDASNWLFNIDPQASYVSVSISYTPTLLTTGQISIPTLTLTATARFPRVVI